MGGETKLDENKCKTMMQRDQTKYKKRVMMMISSSNDYFRVRVRFDVCCVNSVSTALACSCCSVCGTNGSAGTRAARTARCMLYSL